MNLTPLLEAVPGAAVDDGFGPVTVDVPADRWSVAVSAARTALGCTFFDFLSAVDGAGGPTVVCHLVRREPFGHLVLRAELTAERPLVASVADIFAGATWHERETAEMFGIAFVDAAGEPLALAPLLLPPAFDGHPLQKRFELRPRLDRPWPGAKEAGG